MKCCYIITAWIIIPLTSSLWSTLTQYILSPFFFLEGNGYNTLEQNSLMFHVSYSTNAASIFLRTVILGVFLTYSIISSFHNPVLFFFMLSVVLQFFCSLLSHLFFYSTASSVSGFSVILLLLSHTCKWTFIQSLLSAQIPQSSAAVSASVQSKWLSLKQKIHSFHHCPARKMFWESACVQAVCSDRKCYCVFVELQLLNILGNLFTGETFVLFC